MFYPIVISCESSTVVVLILSKPDAISEFPRSIVGSIFKKPSCLLKVNVSEHTVGRKPKAEGGMPKHLPELFPAINLLYHRIQHQHSPHIHSLPFAHRQHALILALMIYSEGILCLYC